ncbi:zinc finger protein 271-like isoform X6 [Leguminivora glycinivorella]|uniref:zinc finger protein 271-like isoform X6 n=1 Tax=Leguminivora glycinivorella TaxID=1035111 RepID=UPI00200E818C|nr:zinc finger protein 271-like isoform X6 [Leguminivora glycinivorella]
MNESNSCRCCLQAAAEMDLTIPYTHLGRTEIYSDMLKNCFDLQLIHSGNGSCGICVTCVGRLRDANDFKLQVQRCQEELQCHANSENVVNKIEKTNHGSEDEGVEPITIKSENNAEDGAVNVCDDLLVKSEYQDVLKNEDDMSQSDPLAGAVGAGAEPRPSTSHKDLRHTSTTADKSDADQPHSGDESHSDTPEKQKKHARQSRHLCDLCDKDFVNNSALKRHQRNIHKTEKMHICYKCNKKFTTKEYLNIHKCPYAGEESLCCNTCGRKFTRMGHLRMHRVSHREKAYKREKCNRRFAHKSCLLQHEQTPCEGNVYICDICKKQFTIKSLLIRHILTHTGVKPYGCNECHKQFSRNESLIAHKRMHTGQKYSCDVCDKQYFDKRQLNRHKLKHTGQKYECTTCSKQFISNYILMQHQRIHAGDEHRLYTCKYCNKRFFTNNDLIRHERIHTGEKPFACESCPRKFKQKTHLATHIKTCKKRRTS